MNTQKKVKVKKAAASKQLVKVVPRKIEKKVEKAVERKVEKKKGNSGIGGALGSVAGSLFGQPAIGGMLGDAAEGLISHIFGSGDYAEVPFDVNNNTITGDVNLITQPTPYFSGNGKSVVIRNREFIGSIGMTDTFVLQGEYIYPQNSFLFPWLSQIAGSFQKFKFHGLVFEFVSTSANAISGVNAGMGQIVMATLYDPNQAIPTSLAQVLNFYFASSTKPSQSVIHPVECDPTTIPISPLWIFDIPALVIPDPHNYTMGVFAFGAQGPVNYSGAGQLWVSYDVELIEPKVEVTSPLHLKYTREPNNLIDWAIERLKKSPPALSAAKFVNRGAVDGKEPDEDFEDTAAPPIVKPARAALR